MDISGVKPDHTFLYKPLRDVQGGGCHLDLWLPQDDLSKPDVGFPVAIMIHGGAFCMGSRNSIPFNQVRYLLQQGIAVVSLAYRLAPHVIANEIRGDLVDAYRYLQDRLNPSLMEKGFTKDVIDPKRCFAMGWSAGGISSLWLGADVLALSKTADVNPLKAVITAYPIADFNKIFTNPSPEDDQALRDLLQRPCYTDIPMASESEPETERFLTEQDGDIAACQSEWTSKIMLSGYLSEIIIGSPAPFAADQSPINLLTAEYPPTFIMVAEADQLIPPSHSKDIHKKLEELGVPVEMAIAREMQHGEAEAMQGTERWSEELGLGWWEEAIVPSLQFAMRHL